MKRSSSNKHWLTAYYPGWFLGLTVGLEACLDVGYRRGSVADAVGLMLRYFNMDIEHFPPFVMRALDLSYTQ